MSAYDEGYEAAKAGRSISQCPYEKDDMRRTAWERGWKAWMTKNKPDAPDDAA